jgi:hypothetical protein
VAAAPLRLSNPGHQEGKKEEGEDEEKEEKKK